MWFIGHMIFSPQMKRQKSPQKFKTAKAKPLCAQLCFSQQIRLDIWQKQFPLLVACTFLNYISTWHSVEMFWFPEHSVVRGHETVDEFIREGTIHQSVGLELALGSIGRI